jgi:exosome complex exonuclease DIS3/RRP44
MEALAAKRIVVAIDGWARGSAYPDGHYVRTLGDANERDVEVRELL